MLKSMVPKAVRVGGVGKSALAQMLSQSNIRLNAAAEALFGDNRLTTLAHRIAIEIQEISVADLGFSEGAVYSQLTERALQFDLIECPLELAPHLRLQYLDQPEGSIGFPASKNRAPPGSLTVASPPLDERDETPKGFYLRRIEGVLWLRGYWSSADTMWHPEDVLVFARKAGSISSVAAMAVGTRC